MNKQQTIDEMKKQIEELSKNLEVLEKSKDDRVEFLREGKYVNLLGNIGNVDNPLWEGNTRALTFATEAIAKKVDRITQQSYKIAQYVFQKEPDYVPDWDDNKSWKCSVYFIRTRGVYAYGSTKDCSILSIVYMPEHVAEQLVEDLNNGDYSID